MLEISDRPAVTNLACELAPAPNEIATLLALLQDNTALHQNRVAAAWELGQKAAHLPPHHPQRTEVVGALRVILENQTGTNWELAWVCTEALSYLACDAKTVAFLKERARKLQDLDLCFVTTCALSRMAGFGADMLSQ
jgi:hypothetical protein